MQTSTAPEIRPIAAANPIRPSFMLQRSAAEADGEDDADDDAALPSPWWAPTQEALGAGASPIATGFDAGSPAVQRTAWTDGGRSTGLAGSPAFGAASSANIPFPRGVQATSALQRSAAPSTRPLPPARGPIPDSAMRASATTSAAVAATTPGATAPGAMAVQGVTAGPVVQMTTAETRPSSPLGTMPTVQREDPPGRPLSQSAGGSVSPTSSGTSSGKQHSERELEELAQALFSRIRSRLRSDLIHDREAKGLTFDNV